MGVDYSLSSLGSYIGSEAICSSSSSSKNMGSFRPWLWLGNAVVEENIFKLKRLLSLKFKSMNENWVNFWRVFLGKISRDFDFPEMKVTVVGLKGIMFDCNFFMLWQY